MAVPKCFLLVLLASAAATAFPAEQPAAPAEGDYVDKAYRFVQQCGSKDLLYCLKMRALTFVDGALRAPGDVPLVDGVTLVRSGAEDASSRAGRALTEAELEASLPRAPEERDSTVETLLVDRVARFLNSHTLQLKFPESSISELRQSVEEGRKKKKKILLPLLIALKLKAAALIPLALGALALLALKALIVGKLALLISALIGLQKLLASQTTKTYEVVAHPHYSHSDHHDHYARALDAQQMAYSAHAPPSDSA
ncbi:uncharacterized protein LOC124154692 [Ischnura elegans]|uniref:uncharacterized protein LOC124154692 n=1 Tax=Ischnura elegans TaxID=197161 RepID=UPI001ED8AD2B|nr:uncharacterized protein LOC124154692 [Ischnura elegans]